MPGLDRTGPRGTGPLTGRGFGPCGKGFASRRGFGRGYIDRFQEPVTLTKEEQKKILESQLKEIEAEQQEIKKRLEELR